MKRNAILKSLMFFSIGVTYPIPFFSTGCAKKESNDVIGSLDGTDWPGVKEGYYFLPTDYVIDEEKNTVTYIGSDQMASDEYLRIPDYVTYNKKYLKVIIGEKCFMDASWINGIVEFNKFADEIPKSCFESVRRTMNIKGVVMNNYPKQINEAAFRDCRFFEYFYVKHNNSLDSNWTKEIESIGNGAFGRCPFTYGDARHGKPLIFSKNLKFLGKNAFEESKFSFLSFSFSPLLTEIPDFAFHNCSNLRRIDFGSNITKIGINAFNSCDRLEIINLPKPDMTFDISEGCFGNCTSLVKFSQTCYFSSFPMNCFLRCSSLEEQPWSKRPTPEWTPIIGESAFEGCNFSFIKFAKGMPRPAKRAFSSYRETIRAGVGMVIDFTDYTDPITGEILPPSPIWEPKDGLIPWEKNERIFNDKPYSGIIRFKGPSTTILPTGWDNVFDTLGFESEEDFQPGRWKIEFVE